MGRREVTGELVENDLRRAMGSQARPEWALQRRRAEAGHTAHTGDELLVLEGSVPGATGERQ